MGCGCSYVCAADKLICSRECNRSISVDIDGTLSRTLKYSFTVALCRRIMCIPESCMQAFMKPRHWQRCWDYIYVDIQTASQRAQEDANEDTTSVNDANYLGMSDGSFSRTTQLTPETSSFCLRFFIAARTSVEPGEEIKITTFLLMFFSTCDMVAQDITSRRM